MIPQFNQYLSKLFKDERWRESIRDAGMYE